jgi:Zn-dependent protease with chaperone function
MNCAAQYFDGLSSASIPVVMRLEHGQLHISGTEVSKNWAFSSLDISERLGNTPRIIRHENEGFCEVTDLSSLQSLLRASGQRDRLVDRLHHSWRGALLSVCLILVFFGVTYQYVLPVVAKVVAMNLPDSAVKILDAGTLESLDKTLLDPSDLSPSRQKAIIDGFAQLVRPQDRTTYHLVFRKSPMIGPNAFALPSGSIVLLDELVALSDNDEEIDGVLAHELGHVQKRHGVRMLLQTSIVGLAMTWWLGDVSSILAAAPAALIGAKYSRDMEREADAYGLALLARNHISSCQLGHLLGKLEAHFQAKTSKNNEKQTTTLNQAADYLSSHPATPERIKALCAKEGK